MTSCTQRLWDFTLVSTDNFDIGDLQRVQLDTNSTEGIDKMQIFCLVPVGSYSLEDAIQNAIDSIPNCVALYDVSVKEKFWWIPYIYGRAKLIVEGKPLIVKDSIR